MRVAFEKVGGDGAEFDARHRVTLARFDLACFHSFFPNYLRDIGRTRQDRPGI